MARTSAGPKPGKKEKEDRSIRAKNPIRIQLRGFPLDSPTILASGILGISFELFPRIIKSGAGAVVSKSIGTLPRAGYGNPTMTGTDCGYLNAIGLANPGAEEFARELQDEYPKYKVPLIVSIFADSPENFGFLAEKFDKSDFLAYELNLSCPHVRDVGSEIGSDPDDASEVVRAVKSKTKKPVLAKMPATILNVPDWSRAVEKAGADAIVAINAVRSMKIDVETRKPILANKFGGLSGPAIKPIAVRSVYEVFESVRIPVIGVGGVSTWRDAIEFFLAGASAVEIGSAIGAAYLSSFQDINSGVLEYLRTNGFRKLAEIVGLAHN